MSELRLCSYKGQLFNILYESQAKIGNRLVKAYEVVPYSDKVKDLEVLPASLVQ